MPITRFQRKPASYIQGTTEPPKRRFPFGKYVYVACIIGILAYAGHWAVRKYVFIEGRGILEPSLIEIKSKISARILEHKFLVDQEADQNAPLVYLDKSDILLEIAAKDRVLKEQSILIRQRILEDRRELDSFQGKRERAEGRLRDAGAEHSRARALLRQDAITRSQAMALENAYRDAQREVALMGREIAACQAKLKADEAEFAEFTIKMDRERQQCEERLSDTVLCAPRQCIITEILKKPGELVHPGDVILRIADPAQIMVKGYFAPENEGSVKTGDQVELIFEDGYRTTGKVEKVYPSALAIPHEYRRAYGALERGIVAEIAPKDKASVARVMNTKTRVVLSKMNWWPLR